MRFINLLSSSGLIGSLRTGGRLIIRLAFVGSACLILVSHGESIAQETKETSKADPKVQWKKVLPESGLEGWEKTNFGGEGPVEIKDGVLAFMPGEPMTGVNKLGKDFPTENFEMQWSAQRIDGSDFFVGITFPVGKEHCSLIVGGWGGGLVGISSIDGNDASENETASYRNFKNGQWYEFKVRVDAKNITVWIDKEQILEVPRGERKFSVRAEVMRSRPLGYCVFQSKVAVKDWVYRSIDATR
ncbi:MAG: DUF1080 domain-containing protein [Planctomycetota bacterium]|jgi:hypothetical protein|nr:DUF1080 domain-containing protein [Planctomycetota bacterium]